MFDTTPFFPYRLPPTLQCRIFTSAGRYSGLEVLDAVTGNGFRPRLAFFVFFFAKRLLICSSRAMHVCVVE